MLTLLIFKDGKKIKEYSVVDKYHAEYWDMYYPRKSTSAKVFNDKMLMGERKEGELNIRWGF